MVINTLFSAVGGFDLDAVVEGRVALFNMWDHEKTLSELRHIDCFSQGNILSMSNMSILGPAEFTEENVPCETGLSQTKIKVLI